MLSGGRRLDRPGIRRRVLRGADRARERAPEARDLPGRAVRAGDRALPGARLRGRARLANDSPFGLTAAIHTRNIHRAMTFVSRVRSGVVVVNGATYGSEPHMPFGGLKRIRQRVARGRDRGAGRVLGLEDRVHQVRPRRRSERRARADLRRPDPARAGSQAGAGQEHPAAGRPSAARVHDRGRAARAGCSRR